MILRIAAHEFRYMLWSLQSLVSFAIFFGIAFLLTANAGEFQTFAPGGNVNANSPYIITQALIVISVFSIIAVPPFIANAVLKDVDSHFDAVLFSAPISKKDYVFGRFLGAFTALILVLSGAPIGMLLGTFWPWSNSELLGPTVMSHYLIVFFGFIIPSIFATSAIVFAVAIKSRSLTHTYLATLGILILYLLGSGFDILTPIWDPFMYKAFEAQTQYWTAVERNTQVISYDHIVLLNRLIWFGIASAFSWIAFRSFSFQTIAKKTKIKKDHFNITEAEPTALLNTDFRYTPSWSKHTQVQQFFLRTKFETLYVIKSQPFLILIGMSVFMLILSLISRETLYGVNSYPLTRFMIVSLSSMIFALMCILVFYSADIIWRERQYSFNEIIDAMPAPNWVFIVSKLIALAFIMLSILLLGIVIAISIQVLNGYHNFELGLYAERGLFYLIVPYIFLAVLTCFFQVLSKNRYFGMLLFGLFMGVIVTSVDFLGFEHPLFSYGLPGIAAPLSDMNGSGRFIQAGYWLRAYWASIAGLLLILTYQLWSRGTMQPIRYRLRALRRLKSPALMIPSLAFFITLIATGTFIYYNTNILNDYKTVDDTRTLRVNYENQYRPFENLPMPRTIDINIDVDIYPYKRLIETRSTHILLNQTNQLIHSIHLTFPFSTVVPMVKVEGGVQTSIDNELHYYIFDLEKPMQPGEKRSLIFETVIQQHGFPHDRPDVTFVRNGTFIQNSQITPYIGFNPDIMIEDKNVRRDYGLPPLSKRPKLDDASQYTNNSLRQDSDHIRFEATVSTVTDQIAISPGYLEKEWTSGERRYFHYKMDKPIRNFYSFLSAEYEVEHDQWRGIDIEVLHHKTHTFNIDRMISGVKDSLAYFSQAFSPYQYKQVRIVEFPAYRQFAQAFPNTIPYSEDIGFVANVTEGDIDMPYYVTAHEVAHQWWGHQVTAANTQGERLIHETLAQYSALLVMEQKYGQNHIRQFLKYELDRYLEGRADDPDGELPLYKVEKQQYIYYRKGAVIMYALKDYLGETVINKALQRLIGLRGFSSTPYATSIDFLALLKEETPIEHHGLIEDFFEKITLFNLELENSRVERLNDGRFKISLDIKAAKYYADAIGNETETPLDIPIDIGLFLKRPEAKDFSSNDVVMLEKHVINSGQSTIEFIVNQKPEFAGIDPYNKLIDRDSNDNLGNIDDK